MQTNFTKAQLQDPHMAASEKILRSCVHCGLCTATCPTYVLLGDELDSPRGRIYLMKDMLENNRPADKELVTHIDRCLSCLACTTTCPAGVDYRHLVDHARLYIEKTYRRPWHQRFLRSLLAYILPYPYRFRLALAGAFFAKPFAKTLQRFGGLFTSLSAMLMLVPTHYPARSRFAPGTSFPAKSPRQQRMALLTGCAQSVLQPGINVAAIALLNRHGIDVTLPKGEGCCGALVHHMGKEETACTQAKANIDAWWREIETNGLEAIVITASGCGAMIKDYHTLLQHDPHYAQKAMRISAMTRDISEVLRTFELGPAQKQLSHLRVAYHSACSMQHGQNLKAGPRMLLKQAGFKILEIAEGHLCCGSAGVYNILQPDIAGKLRVRKIGHIHRLEPDIIATDNIGCISQLAGGTDTPVVHTVELINWAYGGVMPDALETVIRKKICKNV